MTDRTAVVAIDDAVRAGGPIPFDEVADIYLPLSQLLAAQAADRRRHLPSPAGGATSPLFVVGITGSVAVGKSASGRVLQSLLRQSAGCPSVELLPTDGFLLPNRILNDRGLLERKGFPETYDHARLIATLGSLRSGAREVAIPVYSHESYDIVDGAEQRLRRSDVLIVEGLTVLQRPSGGGGGPVASISDHLDASIYVDAPEDAVAEWHRQRLLELRRTPEQHPGEFLRWLQSLSDEEALELARWSWTDINLVNLRDHVAPSRRNATVILENDRTHRVQRVLLRKG